MNKVIKPLGYCNKVTEITRDNINNIVINALNVLKHKTNNK
jgi:hypothetical protein